jgi:hypothetical protein
MAFIRPKSKLILETPGTARELLFYQLFNDMDILFMIGPAFLCKFDHQMKPDLCGGFFS